MGDGFQAEAAGAGENALELGRRMALLGGIQADADEPLAPGQRLVQRALGRRLVEMAQEAEDQCRADAKRPFGVLHGGPQAVDHRSEEHTSELQSLMRISYAAFRLKKKITST